MMLARKKEYLGFYLNTNKDGKPEKTKESPENQQSPPIPSGRQSSKTPNGISKFSLHIFEPISTLTIICQIGFLGAG